MEKADFNEMAMPNSFKVVFVLPWTESEDKNEHPVSGEWKDCFVDAGMASKNKLAVYVYADSEERMVRWMEFMNAHLKALKK